MSNTLTSPTPAPKTSSRLIRAVQQTGAFVLAAAVFGLSYTQSVLYEGNQNTKFLHGLAQSGGFYSLLQDDWLAKTVDPLPLFSLLVNLTARVNENLFYIYYVLLFGIYVYSLIGILRIYFGERWSWGQSLVVYTALLVVHARWVINLVNRSYKIDISFLQYGVAGQYLLDKEFQNSSFGVLLLLSIYLFLRRKYIWSLIWLGVACWLHSAYLFSAAWMVISYLTVILVDNYKKSAGQPLQRLLRAARQPFLLGLLTLGMVLPVVLHNQLYLSASSPEISQKALSILVNQRIPHHALPEVWLNSYAYLQIGLMILGVVLAVKNRLFVVMAFLFGGGAFFTLVQMLTGNLDLAMLGPWRVSVLLVPLSVTLLIGWAVRIVFSLPLISKLPLQWLALPVVLWVAASLVAHGWNIQSVNNTSSKVRRLEKMMDYVIDTRAPGDVYLIPPKDPEFDDFRLYTGAPIFINWKSHPYKDTDVLEWFSRVERAADFYNALPTEKCARLDGLLADYTLTHVVIRSKDAPLDCGFTLETFRSDEYAVYRINR